MGEKKKKKKVLLSGSDPFYLSKKLRRRKYGEVSAQTSQKSQNRALEKKKSCVPCACGASMYPTTWIINRTFSKSEILAESLIYLKKKKKKKGHTRFATHYPFCPLLLPFPTCFSPLCGSYLSPPSGVSWAERRPLSSSSLAKCR